MSNIDHSPVYAPYFLTRDYLKVGATGGNILQIFINGSGEAVYTNVVRHFLSGGFTSDGESRILSSQKVERRGVGAGGYSVSAFNDYYIGKTGITGGGDTITLPAAATVGAGRVYVIKDESGTAGTNNITIDGNAAETIDGSLTRIINTNYGSATLICDGANWFII